MLPQLKRIRWGVRAVLVLGVAASVTANVLHARDNLISQVIAAWPPLALLVTIELISRIPVHRRGLAAVRLVATGTIAGIAAWVSYWHMAGVVARYGETGATPYLMPFSVDGLVLVASVCLVELAGRIRDTNEPAKEPAVDVAQAAIEQPADEPAEPAGEQAEPAEPDTRNEASPKATPAADAIARVRRRNPNLTQEEVAQRAKVSISSVKRHWTATTPDAKPEPEPAPEPVDDRLSELEGAST